MHVLEELDVFDDVEPRSAAMNMAVDEALLESAAKPALRFYRWARPALSFGYFGSFAEVADEELRRDLVRRWTGGGIVLHGEDVTYSVILPHTRSQRVPAPRSIYQKIHDAIRRALPRDLNAVLAAEAAPKVSDACFANPVEADVLIDGRKIAGAAQRRTRAGLLHQGSIQHGALPLDFRAQFAAAFCASFEYRSLANEQLQRAKIIATEKYGTSEWLRRR